AISAGAYECIAGDHGPGHSRLCSGGYVRDHVPSAAGARSERRQPRERPGRGLSDTSVDWTEWSGGPAVRTRSWERDEREQLHARADRYSIEQHFALRGFQRDK